MNNLSTEKLTGLKSKIKNTIFFCIINNFNYLCFMIDFSEFMKEEEIYNALIPEELRDDNVKNFLSECLEMVRLYAKKNHDYGNSFNKGMDTLGLSYAVGRIFDKTNRAVNLVKKPAQIKEETICDTIQDLACYAVMTNVYIKNNIIL